MGRAKHSSEEDRGKSPPPSLSHYCVLPFPFFLFSLKPLVFKHKLDFFGPLFMRCFSSNILSLLTNCTISVKLKQLLKKTLGNPKNLECFPKKTSTYRKICPFDPPRKSLNQCVTFQNCKVNKTCPFVCGTCVQLILCMPY